MRSVAVAEGIGTFALVFIGCGAIMVDAEGAALGPVGIALNPARSLGPVLASGTFDALWVYLTAPFLGAALGVLAYSFFRGSEHAVAQP